MQVIRVPSLAENVEQVTIGKWLVREGDAVEPGQEVVELLTEKAEFTLEVRDGGRVTAIFAPEKSVLPVGFALCVLDAEAGETTDVRRENQELLSRVALARTVRLAAGSGDGGPLPATPRAGNVRATPAARRLARERGVELDAVVAGLGVEGIVREEHVRRFLEQE